LLKTTLVELARLLCILHFVRLSPKHVSLVVRQKWQTGGARNGASNTHHRHDRKGLVSKVGQDVGVSVSMDDN
jgi:hypothetical protein